MFRFFFNTIQTINNKCKEINIMYAKYQDPIQIKEHVPKRYAIPDKDGNPIWKEVDTELENVEMMIDMLAEHYSTDKLNIEENYNIIDYYKVSNRNNFKNYCQKLYNIELEKRNKAGKRR